MTLILVMALISHNILTSFYQSHLNEWEVCKYKFFVYCQIYQCIVDYQQLLGKHFFKF